jgi:hypothetical protein
MRTVVRLALAAAATITMGAGIAACRDVSAPESDTADAPPDLKVGSWWEFNDPLGTHRVKLQAIQGNTLHLIDNDGREVLYSMSLNLKKMPLEEHDSLIFEPDNGILSFPLSPGRSWTNRLRIIVDSGGQRTALMFRTTGRSEGIEEVETPAGRFRAFKVIADSGLGKGGPTECWYAPKVKWVVKCHSGERGVAIPNFEVTSYHLE